MISLQPKGRERLIWTGALLAPIMAIQVARLFQVDPVRSAAASVDLPSPMPSPKPAPRTTPAQERAIAWIAQRDRDRIADPFSPVPTPVADQTPPERVASLPEPDPMHRELAPIMDLTGVMDGQRGPLASINRKIFRLGDEVVPGWTLESVDARQRVVTVRSTDGNALELRIKPPNAQP